MQSVTMIARNRCRQIARTSRPAYSLTGFWYSRAYSPRKRLFLYWSVILESGFVDRKYVMAPPATMPPAMMEAITG